MIRKVRTEDAEALVSIFNEYIEKTEITLETKMLSKEEFAERIERITKEYPYYVFEEEGVVLGYAYLDHFNYRQAYDSTADLSIYLSMGERSRGIGTKLYQTIEQEALKMGICKMISLITSANAISMAFHKKLGYTLLCDIKNVAYKHDKWISVSFMEKNLQTPEVPAFVNK